VRFGPKLEVGQAIVSLLAVDVVNLLRREEGASQGACDDEPMLRHVALLRRHRIRDCIVFIDQDKHVSLLHRASAAPTGVISAKKMTAV
jgi:hypothetical protein